jgi:hypothetical protein
VSWWVWVLIVVAVLVLLTLAVAGGDIRRYTRMRRM